MPEPSRVWRRYDDFAGDREGIHFPAQLRQQRCRILYAGEAGDDNREVRSS